MGTWRRWYGSLAISDGSASLGPGDGMHVDALKPSGRRVLNLGMEE